MCSLLSTFDSPKVAKANSPIPLHAVVFGDHLTFFSMITFFTCSVTAVLFGDHLTFFSVVKNSRDSRLDLATFYLLWQGGLRLCEVEDLTLSDLHIPEQYVLIRQSKGLKDRTVYLTEAAVAAIEDYLTVRGPGRSDNLFLYRHRPVSKDLIRGRLKAAGERAGVKVTPHMLRHTFATQLLNVGCKITTIQALLGHSKLNSTMIYARVHDQTVAKDYYTAMTNIEAKLAAHLQALAEPPPEGQTDTTSTTANLLTLLSTLQDEPLTTSQQATINQLQCGLLSLAESLNTEPMLLNQVPQKQPSDGDKFKP